MNYQKIINLFSYSPDRTRHDLNQNTSGHEKYTAREQDDLQMKHAQLARKLESLELKKIHKVNTLSSEEICVICDRKGHSTAGCPTLLAFKKIL